MVENNFSNAEGINLKWLQNCIWGTALIFLTVVIVIVSRDFMGVQYNFRADLIFYSMFVLAIFCLGYFGIRHQGVFVDNVVVQLAEEQANKIGSEYQKSGLKEEMAQAVHQRLLQVMAQQKPHLDPKLTLSKLSDLLEVSANHLSQVINQYEGQNFNDFVNKYRVEEFIENASKNSSFSILAHALDAGFNSKSSFNSVFKKHKGVTPSQYMAKLKAS